MMFIYPRKLFSKPLSSALVALMLACAAPVWADNQAQYQQAVTEYNAGHYSEVLRLLQPLAEQGDAEAQYKLGLMYANGQGVAQDYQQAFSWFQKSANQGYDVAQYKLGEIYEQGQGVTQDYQQAIVWYQKAAVQGYDVAQYALGNMYRDGKGVVKDYQQAKMWYQKVLEQPDTLINTVIKPIVRNDLQELENLQKN